MAAEIQPSNNNLLEATKDDGTPANDITGVSLDDDMQTKPPAYSEPEAKVSDQQEVTLNDNNDQEVEEKKQPINSTETKEFIGFFSAQKEIPRYYLDSETTSLSPRDGNQEFPIVLKAELAGNWLTKHVLFVIKLPDGNEIKRRYSDFMWLRGWLTKIYLAAFIPPLPQRLAIAMWPKGYLQTRKRELQVFLKRCSITPFIANDETWKMYLQTKESGSFEKVRKRWDKDHGTMTIRETCDQLEKTFPNIMNEPLPNLEENALEGRFEEIKEFVTDSLRVLHKLFDNSKSLVDSFVNKVDSWMTMRDDLWLYESIMKKRFSDESAEDKERLTKVLNKIPTPISKSLVSWCQALHEVPTWLELYMVSNIKRNLMDFQVLQECLAERVKILKDLYAARNKAAKWKKIEELRSKDVAQKHADELRQEELEMLSRILYKLSTKQFIYVWQASLHRSSESTKKLMVVQAKKYDQLSQIWKSSLELLKDHSAQQAI